MPVIPHYDVGVQAAIPPSATFWTPSSEELDEGGAPGDFHDTELIQTDLTEAQAIIEAEQAAVEYVDSHSATAREFDDLASDIEFEVPDFPSDDAPPFIAEDSWYGVGGLEIGVAGLVYALNAVGIVTSASCRSHHQSYEPWSAYPVVIFAADQHQLTLLQPLIATTGCGLEIDELNRPQLVAVIAPSILEMTTLAKKLHACAETFRQPKA